MSTFSGTVHNNKNNLTTDVIEKLDDALKTFHSNKDFYNYSKLSNAIKILVKNFDMIFNLYFILYSTNEKIGEKFSTLEYFVQNETLNPFYSFFLEKIQNGDFDNYENIFISQSFDVQTFATFTLAYLLKKHTNKTVCIGGNYISRLTQNVNINQLLEKYFDYILVGLGEESIIPFCKFLENKEKAENVAGLIYKKDGQIVQNSPNYFLNNIKKTPQIAL